LHQIEQAANTNIMKVKELRTWLADLGEKNQHHHHSHRVGDPAATAARIRSRNSTPRDEVRDRSEKEKTVEEKHNDEDPFCSIETIPSNTSTSPSSVSNDDSIAAAPILLVGPTGTPSKSDEEVDGGYQHNGRTYGGHDPCDNNETYQSLSSSPPAVAAEDSDDSSHSRQSSVGTSSRSGHYSGGLRSPLPAVVPFSPPEHSNSRASDPSPRPGKIHVVGGISGGGIDRLGKGHLDPFQEQKQAPPVVSVGGAVVEVDVESLGSKMAGMSLNDRQGTQGTQTGSAKNKVNPATARLGNPRVVTRKRVDPKDLAFLQPQGAAEDEKKKNAMALLPRRRETAVERGIRKFGPPRKSIVETRTEELSQRWAESNSPQHVRKVKWGVATKTGEYQKKIVIERENK
jgi:hypothetical protein